MGDMNKKTLHRELKTLKEKLGFMRVSEELMKQKLEEKPKEVTREVTKFVDRTISCPLPHGKEREKSLTLLDSDRDYLRLIIKEQREIMEEVVDKDGWMQEVEDIGDGRETRGVHCIYCDAASVDWDHALRYEHLETCPWKRAVEMGK